ncbi:precorrin-2 C(20)-methyltransferase [Thiocapsa imhoffii]|uniref:Precorrin-2 C(20)-methyltransferase n=1 Tax=Thiocapsa imhoffii TaxID=382777 RepID=A0A9X0WJF5_9GAMM|nr:precorrin-2 C(20)-methyltransferase [Thiocapsa imhoffii]MBK1645595.1 precorrin-2 C(20)-methyltransferase [Thiocapsa imhoffii]
MTMMDAVAETATTPCTGRLIGASLGPGDPMLITRAAWSALTSDACWAWPVDAAGSSYALAIVERAGLAAPTPGLALHFPMTRDAEALARAWATAAEQVAARLATGQDVVFLVEGDASTYATFGHLARVVREVDPGVRIEVIPGVSSFNAAAARLGQTLVDGEEPLAVYAAPAAMRELDALLDRFDALVLLKVRPVLDDLIDALAARGMLGSAVFIERVGTPRERLIRDLATLRGEPVHYLSLVLIRHARGRGLGQVPIRGSLKTPSAPSERQGTTLIAWTRMGLALAQRLTEHLPDASDILIPRPFAVSLETAPESRCRLAVGAVAARLPELFRQRRALVFIGSSGVAWRLCAPLIRDKRRDPAVLAIDEAGRFVIPLLGGHLAGANALAVALAAALAATPVLTTASDVQGTIAVDLFGHELGWRIEADPETLKRAAACVVNGAPVVVIDAGRATSWWPADRPWPANLRRVDRPDQAGEACAYLWISLAPVAAAQRARLGDCVVVYRPPASAAP